MNQRDEREGNKWGRVFVDGSCEGAVSLTIGVMARKAQFVRGIEASLRRGGDGKGWLATSCLGRARE